LKRDQVEALGLFDPEAVERVFAEYWQTRDPVLAKRQDIVVNHLLGMHLLHQGLLDG